LKNIRPKYDDGKTVYEDLIKQLDTAITQIKGAVVSENLNISSADVMFHGDQTMWVKFANTLKLRLLMHQANRSDRATYIQAEIAKIVAEGSGFLGSGEDASVNPTFQVDKPNAFYASFGFNQVGNQATDFWRANIIAMNFLKGTNDPRLGAFYKPIVNGLPGGASEPFSQPTPNNYRGNQYGLSINNVTYPYQTANYVSQVGGIGTAGAVGASAVGLVKGYNQNSWILTSVESLFLQAEATERGWLAGNKETAYKNAVLESFKWLNVGGSAAAATTAFNTWYGDQATNATVNYTIATDKPKLIAYQKYLAMNGTNHLEAWTDYRRNGNYPVIPLSVNPGRTSNTLPYRLLFPQAEINLNTANVPTVGRKTADAFSDKIWWMP
jgi:Starch-binding associating with outer membrane